ncbi:MAG: hypothetical protein IT341_04155 [Chloroflexi bacterium]|nr:hypothetical protein [Chloroflexota bacterium]
MAGLRTAGAFVTAALLAMGMCAATPRPVGAWSQGACPTSNGVTVVVDFGVLGSGVTTRCVPQTPASGLEALATAGFAVTPVTTLPGFVCRIDGLPGPDAEACVSTPPAGAHWSYWTADRGGPWQYSPVGAAASRPIAGRVEGWRFATGGTVQAPSVPPPPSPPTPSPRPTATPTASTPPRASTPSTATHAPRVSPTQAPTPRSSLTPSTPGPTLADPSRPAGTAPATDAAAQPATSRTPSPGPTLPAGAGPPRTPDAGPLGTVVGAGLLVLVGGLAFAARQRGAHRV